VPLRESNSQRPTSIADRLSLLSVSQQTWTTKVSDKDMKQFTVDEKLGRLTGNLVYFLINLITESYQNHGSQQISGLKLLHNFEMMDRDSRRSWQKNGEKHGKLL